MLKTFLVFSPLILLPVLTSCSSEKYKMYSTEKLCVGYLNNPPYNLYQSARKAELDKRGVTTCTPYETKAAQIKRLEQQQLMQDYNNWKTLEKGVRDIERNRPKCTAFTFSKAGVKQCLN